MWGYNKQHLTLLRNALSLFVNPELITTVANAQDLGCNMTYTGPPRLGKLSKRIQGAHRRLERLGKLQYDIKTKVLLVKGGVYSSIFWGLDLVPFGSQHLQRFRVQISNAILGFSSSRNSALSIAFMPGLRDPAVALAFRVIAAASRFLLLNDVGVRASFYEKLARHSGLHHECRGPVGVLKFYLQKICWQSTKGGDLWVSAFVKIHLLDSRLASIVSWLVWTWQQDVINQFSLRKGHFLSPPVSIADTVAILKSFELAQQKPLLEESAGGFQTQHQKSTWDPQCDDKCRFCPFPDSRFHRVFQCAATGYIRLQYQDVLDVYLEQESNIPELPVIWHSPQEEFIRMCHYRHPEAVVDESLLKKIQRLSGLAPVTFYTDGSESYQNPQSQTSRSAAYAIVLDICVDNDHRRDMAKQFQLTGCIPSTLQVISVAHATGAQTIYRSELYAILKICEWFSNTVIFSDSAAALASVSRCQNACTSEMLGMAPESDLMQRLWPHLITSIC